MTEPTATSPEDPPRAGSAASEWDRHHRPAGSWQPPRSRMGREWELLWGGILIAVGGWFFLDQTLGLDLPRLAWRDIWPIFLILVGAVVVIRSTRRRGA